MSTVVVWALLAATGAGFANGAAGGAAGEFVAARDLYAAADYAGALSILNRLKTTPTADDDVVSIEQYRALCYLALGDTSEAQRVLEGMVARSPFYRPSGADMSPRLASLFAAVRRRVLPDLVRRTYATARAAYTRNEYDQATAGFRTVVRLLDEPEIAAADGSFADLRVLADEFIELAVRATAPHPAEPHAASTAATSSPAWGRKVSEIYTAESEGVRPPITISQTLPRFAGALRNTVTGSLEVTIAADGRVVDAKMRIPTNTAYDAIAVAAARKWQYKPASADGAPVKYLKIININLIRPEPSTTARNQREHDR